MTSGRRGCGQEVISSSAPVKSLRFFVEGLRPRREGPLRVHSDLEKSRKSCDVNLLKGLHELEVTSGSSTGSLVRC